MVLTWKVVSDKEFKTITTCGKVDWGKDVNSQCYIWSEKHVQTKLNLN